MGASLHAEVEAQRRDCRSPEGIRAQMNEFLRSYCLEGPLEVTETEPMMRIEARNQ